jgi:hypothetical protein
MKAQLTLETIIMLVVLLVLAGVMITLILTTLKPPTQPKQAISKQEFLSMCEEYCNDPEKTLKYCSTYWDGNDWNGNRVPNELIKFDETKLYGCEDRVYCFLVKPCDRLGTGINLIRRCKEIICGTYLDLYEDPNIATQHLKNDVSFSNKCSLASVAPEDNWYERAGFEEGCVSSRGSTTTTQQILPPPSLPGGGG